MLVDDLSLVRNGESGADSPSGADEASAATVELPGDGSVAESRSRRGRQVAGAERAKAELVVGREDDRPVLAERRGVGEEHLRIETGAGRKLGLHARERSAS